MPCNCCKCKLSKYKLRNVDVSMVGCVVLIITEEYGHE